MFRPAAAAIVLAGALSGCGLATAIKAAHALATGNKALDNLTKQLQQSENQKFDVTYETTGSSPSTVEYAADPPTNYAFITPAQNGSTASELVQNSSGLYSCNQASGSGASWTCVKLSQAQDANYGAAFEIYTGAYWYGILEVYSSVASLAGVNVKQTTMTVNGFKMNCVVITSSNSGSSGNSTGTWCITAQGLLGYTAGSGSSSATEIKSYTGSPAASLFQLPAGATITTLPTGETGIASTSTVASTTGNTGSTTSSTTGSTGGGATGSTGSTSTSSTSSTTGATGTTGG